MVPEPGLELGIYRLTQRLGAGGMGEVWKAEDTRLHRSVAIKLLPESMTSDAESRARLLREARTAGALYHPNIATIHAIELDGETPYLVMEFVDGETLTRAIGSRRLSETQIADAGRAIADALAEAHSKGIIHRDIKPDNVVLSGNRVKVLDFGIAKRYGADAEIPAGEIVTEALGVVLGTVAYMSPEQATGKQLDGRSDIFALGVMLYQALTGQLPFRGNTNIETLKQILRSEPPELAAIAPAVSPELAAIVTRCLRKNPDERYQDADELAGDLAREAARGLANTPPRPQLRPPQQQPVDSGAQTAVRDAEAMRPTAPLGHQPVTDRERLTAPGVTRPNITFQAPEPLMQPPMEPSLEPAELPEPGVSNVHWAIGGASFVLVLAVAGGFLATRIVRSKPATAQVAVAQPGITAGAPARVRPETSPTAALTASAAPPPAATTSTVAPPVKARASTPTTALPTHAGGKQGSGYAPPVATAPPPPAPAADPMPSNAKAAYRAGLDHLEASGWHYLDGAGHLTAGAIAARPYFEQAVAMQPDHTSAKLYFALTSLFSQRFNSASNDLLPLLKPTSSLTVNERALASYAYSASSIAASGHGTKEYENSMNEALKYYGSNPEFAAFAEDSRKLIARRAK